MVGYVSIKSRSATHTTSLALSCFERSTLSKYFLTPSLVPTLFITQLSVFELSKTLQHCNPCKLCNIAETKKALSSLRRLSSKSYPVWLLKDLIYFHCISLRKQIEVSIYFLVKFHSDHVNYTNIRRKCHIIRKC